MFGVFARFRRRAARSSSAARGSARSAPTHPSLEVTPQELDARAQSGGRRHSRQVLDLTYVRTALGQSWPKVAPRLAMLIAQIVSQQLGARGCFARDGDRYLILFERTSDRAARARVERIAALIARLLPGKPDDEAKRRAIAAISGQPRKRRGWLKRLFGRLTGGKAEAPARAGGPGDAPAEAPTAAQGPSRQRAQAAPSPRVRTVVPVGGQAIEAPAVPAALAVPAAPAVAGPPARPAAAAVNPAPAAGTRAAPPRPSAVPGAAARQKKPPVRRTGPREFPPPGLTFVYQPLWEVRAGRISTYIATPVCDGEEENELLVGHEVMPQPADPRHLAQLDELLLRQAIRDVTQASAAAGRVGVSVHFSTLSDPARRQSYLMHCAGLSQEARERVVAEICDTPDEAATQAIEAIVRELCVFVRDVVAQVPVYQWDLRRWKDAGVMSVGVNRARNSMNETEFFAKFNRFAALAADTGLRSYLQNADTLSLTVAAVGAGATLVSSPLVADFDLTKRFAVVPYGLEQLYDRPALKAVAG